MNEIDVARHSPLIDPQLHVWGWEIPAYLFLGGMAAGVMILGAALWMRREDRSAAARWLAFAAPVLVSLGMGALFLDLANKLHVWRFYLAF
ncbi:MAG TPA: NrfD/PsrC family molybdoenzyme membrane anchor subunit, partial [Anaeromyxobacter sp.]|nr:NrfD/PsrC family molybdoenzyme membrane anchor subunit [Anaeromyxobacter sp.]